VGMNRSTYRVQKTRHPSNREVRRILLISRTARSRTSGEYRVFLGHCSILSREGVSRFPGRFSRDSPAKPVESLRAGCVRTWSERFLHTPRRGVHETPSALDSVRGTALWRSENEVGEANSRGTIAKQLHD